MPSVRIWQDVELRMPTIQSYSHNSPDDKRKIILKIGDTSTKFHISNPLSILESYPVRHSFDRWSYVFY